MIRPAPLIVVLICSVFSINAQITIKGKLIDTQTKEAIPFVNIGIVELSKGTVSDFEGRFELKASSGEDIVSISSIGYEVLKLKVKDIGNEIELTPKKYELKQIEIEANRFGEEKIFGVRNKERGHSIGFGSAQLGTEIGAVIKIQKTTYVKSANFVLNHAKGDSLLFRVNVYEYNDGVIGRNLLPENIFIKEKQRKGTISVDLTKYKLILESDVLLTLEWLRNFDEIGNKGITFDTKKSKKAKGVYLKYSSNAKFVILPYQKKRKPCFYFIGKETR